jgi:hypothetical protein
MARLPRIVIPQVPHHVTQRGNRRLPVFFGDDDRRLYLQLLAAASRAAKPRPRRSSNACAPVARSPGRSGSQSTEFRGQYTESIASFELSRTGKPPPAPASAPQAGQEAAARARAALNCYSYATH